MVVSLAVLCPECVALFAFLQMLLFLLLLILLSIWDVPFGALCGLEEGILPNQMFIVAALIKFELIWYSAPLWDCGALGSSLAGYSSFAELPIKSDFSICGHPVT